MHGVAEYMYQHANEYNLNNKEEMYLLGLIHDIGYLYGEKEQHEQLGAELLGIDTYYGQLVQAHGITPQTYKQIHSCSDSEIPNELILLWTADMSVDLNGREVGFQERLEDIAFRHGRDSKAYQNCCDTIAWLENRKAVQFITQ